MDSAPQADELNGVLTIDPTVGGKRFQGTWIETDEARYVLSYRPDPRYFAFQNKRVVATGEKYMPGMHEQHIDAPHFRVHDIRLADGEVAYAAPPTEVLAPPTVRSLAEAEQVSGRWGRFVGQLTKIEAGENGWVSAVLVLTDGEVALERLNLRAGQDGLHTVICAIQRDGSGIVGIHGVAVCPGDVEHCGSGE